MASKYTLPNGGASPLFMRNLVIWGLPLLGWIILIAAWMAFSGKDEDPKKPEAEKTMQQEAHAAQNLSAPQQSQPTTEQGGAPQTPVTPAGTTPTQTPTTPQVVQPVIKAPYDFKTATSHIGLAKEIACQTGVLVDANSRKVLWAKGADRAVPIASMTKMMTLLLIEEAIAQGKLSRDTIIPVTKAAYEIGGSQVWLDPRESFPLQELLKAIAIKSANDAAYLVGEYLCEGDINTFVERMNKRARELGMNRSTFYDAHGLGDKQKRNNLSSAHDMIILAERLLDYPEVMKLASTRSDTFRNGKLELINHNNLVRYGTPGVDGLKTGYTRASGFCVTFTCLRGGRRLIGCVTGFKSAKDRDAFCRSLLDWGYSQK